MVELEGFVRSDNRGVAAVAAGRDDLSRADI